MLKRTGAVVILAVAVVDVVGCGQSIATVNNAADPPAPTGAQLAQSMCAQCHDPGDGTYSGRTSPVVGMVYPANLTPDPDTGIGSWTDDDIRNALVLGLDDQAAPLCPVMPRFNLPDEQFASLVAFLRALPSVTAAIPPSVCE